jgi:hypothetical protein
VRDPKTSRGADGQAADSVAVGRRDASGILKLSRAPSRALVVRGGNMHRWLWAAVAAICVAGLAAAQTAQQAYPVELSMPFGTAAGKLVTSGANLIFVNDPDVGKSFTIPRNNLQIVDLKDGVLSVALEHPMKDETGGQSRLSFRFTNPADADSVVRWLKTTNPETAGADRAATGAQSVKEPKITDQQISYQVRHNHRVGSCTGRLIVTAERINYESLTDVNDSRQWSMKDVKEVKHTSPYKLSIKPFTGKDYSFEFLGTSMKNEDYAALTKAIAAARAQ